MIVGSSVGPTEPTARLLSLSVLPGADAFTSTRPSAASSIIDTDGSNSGLENSASAGVELRASGDGVRLKSPRSITEGVTVLLYR